ncbi:MAG: hypothetical protein JSR77_01050 [Planctomycetes bacterium]|nr:hypothetical protein [Planctomycetota bacterium]
MKLGRTSMFALTLAAGLSASATDIVPSDYDGHGTILPELSTDKLFLAAWAAGLAVADTDRSGLVDGFDIEAYYKAAAADMNRDGSLGSADIGEMFARWVDADPIADLNFDGGVDGADIEAFFTAMESYDLPSQDALFDALWQTGNAEADLNGDGVIDRADRAIFEGSKKTSG